MTFQFNGFLFPGINEKMDVDPPEFPRVRTTYWGLHGESEIRGGRSGRTIRLRTLLRSIDNPYQTYEDLAEVLYQLERLVGEHGELTILNLDNGLTRTFANTTFEGFVAGPEQSDGPLPDVAGALGGGWWIRGVATWHDLGPIV